MSLLVCEARSVFLTQGNMKELISSLINLYHLDLILHMQGQMSQYLTLWLLRLCFKLWDMWVAMQVASQSCVTNVW